MLHDIKRPHDKFFYVDMGSPSYFLGGGKKILYQFSKNYHFIVYTYFCNFPLPMYSAVSILSNNLQKVNQIIFFNEFFFKCLR